MVGGAYVGANEMQFDVSDVAYVTFDVEADVDGDIYVSVFGADNNKKVFPLVANEKQTDLAVKVKDPYKKSGTLFSFGGSDDDRPVGSKISFTNFAFYDKDDKEIVPPIIEKEIDNTPMDGTWRGFFKLSMDGIEPQVWDNTFELDMPSLVKKGGVDNWWGGAFVGANDTAYDMSNIASAMFDIVSDTDGGVYVNVFGDAANRAELTLEANVPQKNVKIDMKKPLAKSISFVSFGGWDDGGKMGNGATITITNFVFYDKNGSEIVPKSAKKLVASDAPNFGGFFKSSIDALDVQIWDGTFELVNPTIVKKGSWWGGAFLGANNLEYDVSKIKSAKFKCTIHENALDATSIKGGLSVKLFGDAGKETKFENLELDKELTLEATLDSLVEKSNILFSIAGIDPQQTTLSTYTIKDFAFYDADGNEVVPQIVQP